MSYCSVCGNMIPDGNGFCGKCGSPVNGAAPSVLDNVSILRKESLAKIGDMISYFGKKEDLYNALTNCVNEIEHPRRVRYSKEKGTLQIVIGGLLMLFSFPITLALYCLIAVLCEHFTGNAEYFNEEQSTVILISVFASLLVLGLILLIIGIVRHVKSGNTKRQERGDYINGMKQINSSIVSELEDYYLKYKEANGNDCPVSFPNTHPNDLRKIEATIAEGRADSIKEAINVILQDNRNSQIQKQLEELQKHASKSALYSKIAAISSNTVLFLSAVNYFKNNKR